MGIRYLTYVMSNLVDTDHQSLLYMHIELLKILSLEGYNK